MKAFYSVIDTLKAALEAEPFINSVSFGDLDNIDLKKQGIFPLGHIMVTNATIGERVVRFDLTFFVMDIVDFSKEEGDSFTGNDNEQDVLNTQLAVATRIVNKMQRGTLYQDLYQVEGEPTAEPFTDRFENALAGWAVSVQVTVKNDMTTA